MTRQPCPSFLFLQALHGTARRTAHPFGGVEFRAEGQVSCLAVLKRRDWRTVEISGMYSARSGGGRHALAAICRLADACGARLVLTAAPVVPERIGLEGLVAWYARMGFAETGRGRTGTAMERVPRSPAPA